MKKNRGSKLTAWLLAVIMVLCVYTLSSFAEEETTVPSDPWEGPGPIVISLPITDSDFDVSLSLQQNNKNVDLKDAEPDKTYTMILNVAEKQASGAKTLPDNTDTVRMFYSLEALNMTAENGSNTDVSWTYDDAAKHLVFKWQDGKKTGFTANVSVTCGMVTYPLYNIAKIGDLYYRLAKTEIQSKKLLKNVLGKNLDASDYVTDDYDFTNLTITDKGKDYIYQCEANQEAIDDGANYYTITSIIVSGVKNKIGALDGNKKPRWIVPEEQRYDDKNETDSMHRDFILQLVENKNGLTLNKNGGTVREEPEFIHGIAGKTVILPDLQGTKDGQPFIGWCEVSNITAKNAGTSNNYHKVYKPGESYTLKSDKDTLYAVYNTTDKKIQFGIRKDGVIQDEPNNYDTGSYGGHFKVDGILKEGHWVIDIDSTKQITDYYVANNVTANLNWIPSVEQVKEALKKDGNIDFDPETMYIHWYVLKHTGKEWHIDGVIRMRKQVGVTYNANAPETDTTFIRKMPGGSQVVPGKEVLIGMNQKTQQVEIPEREGYVFTGWNTMADGSGTTYNGGESIRLTENLNLYAQWKEVSEGKMIIIIESDWPAGKAAYTGTMITLTAKLTGFEGKTYTLQWQYSIDKENWFNEPDAHGINFTYEMNATTAQYTWRVVALDVK